MSQGRLERVFWRLSVQAKFDMKKVRNLLVVTQEVDYDHDRVRFMCSWLEEFAKYHDRVHVICIRKGNIKKLPGNVKVYSLGKGKPRILQVLTYWRFLFGLRKCYGLVFAHNFAHWVTLGFPFYRLGKKTVFFWHCNKEKKSENFLGVLLCDRLLTHSKYSFPYPMPGKTSYFPHGIDMSLFKPKNRQSSDPFTILAVGRASPEKRFEMLAEVIKGLQNVKVRIISAVTCDKDTEHIRRFADKCKELGVAEKFEFKFNVPNKLMPYEYARADVSVNLCTTGALDKVVLESMASAIPVILCNRSFKQYLGELWAVVGFDESSVSDLRHKIKNIVSMSDLSRKLLAGKLRQIALENHNVPHLISKLESEFEKYG